MEKSNINYLFNKQIISFIAIDNLHTVKFTALKIGGNSAKIFEVYSKSKNSYLLIPSAFFRNGLFFSKTSIPDPAMGIPVYF